MNDRNLKSLTEEAQCAFRLFAAVTLAEHSPTWYRGDEFEAVRKASSANLAAEYMGNGYGSGQTAYIDPVTER